MIFLAAGVFIAAAPTLHIINRVMKDYVIPRHDKKKYGAPTDTEEDVYLRVPVFVALTKEELADLMKSGAWDTIERGASREIACQAALEERKRQAGS